MARKTPTNRKSIGGKAPRKQRVSIGVMVSTFNVNLSKTVFTLYIIILSTD